MIVFESGDHFFQPYDKVCFTPGLRNSGLHFIVTAIKKLDRFSSMNKILLYKKTVWLFGIVVLMKLTLAADKEYLHGMDLWSEQTDDVTNFRNLSPSSQTRCQFHQHFTRLFRTKVF